MSETIFGKNLKRLLVKKMYLTKMTHIADSPQGAIKMFWLHFWELSSPPSLYHIQYMVDTPVLHQRIYTV